MTEERLREGAKAFAKKVFDDIREFSKDPVVGVNSQKILSWAFPDKATVPWKIKLMNI